MSETSFLNSCNPPTLFDLTGKVFWIMLKITEFWILISTKEGKKKGRNICRFHLSLMYAGILWVNVVSVLFSSWGEMLLFFFSISCLACHSDWGQAVGRTACFLLVCYTLNTIKIVPKATHLLYPLFPFSLIIEPPFFSPGCIPLKLPATLSSRQYDKS